MQDTNHPRQQRKARSRDLLVAFLCGGFVAVMVGVSFAAVPLYSWFCRTTGFGGTTQVAKSLPKQQSARTITVRFDSNVAGGLPWRFEPERNTIDVRPAVTVSALPRVGADAILIDLQLASRIQVGPDSPDTTDEVWLGPRAPADALAKLRAAGLIGPRPASLPR